MRKFFCWLINNHKWDRILQDGHREVYKCTECGKCIETYKGKKTRHKF